MRPSRTGPSPTTPIAQLTPKGEQQSRSRRARRWPRLGVEVEACYTSPKVRARDTARLACEALGVEVAEDDVDRGLDFDAADAEALAGAHEGHVLVVGHEPDFSQVVLRPHGRARGLQEGRRRGDRGSARRRS